MGDADSPGKAVGLRTYNADIAAEIDEAVRYAEIGANLCRSIGRIFFAKSAKIELHAGLAEVKLVAREDYPLETNAGQYCIDRCLNGQTRSRKVPCLAKQP